MKTSSSVSSLQEKKLIRQELQKWAKNVLYLVGFEEVAQELLGPKKWKKITSGLSIKPSSSFSSPSSLMTLIKDESCPLDSSTAEQDTDEQQDMTCDVPLPAVVDETSNDTSENHSSENHLHHEDEPLDLSIKKNNLKTKSASPSSFLPSYERYTPQLPLSCFPKEAIILANNSELKSSSSTSSSPLMVVNPPPPSSSVLASSSLASSSLASSLKATRDSTWKRNYTEEGLNQALEDILLGKLGTRRAAVIYGIPRSTLRNKVYKLEKSSPLASARLPGRRARQSNHLLAISSSQTSSSTIPALNSSSSSAANTKSDLETLASKDIESTSNTNMNSSPSSSLLQVKKEPRIMCRNKIKRKGTTKGSPSPSLLDQNKQSSLLEETTSENFKASELLKQMLRDNIVNKKPSSISSTTTTTSGMSPNSLFNSKPSVASTDSFMSSMSLANMLNTSGVDLSVKNETQASPREEDEDNSFQTKIFDQNSRLKAALNHGVSSLGLNNNNNTYQPHSSQLFPTSLVPNAAGGGGAGNESLVNPFEMLSSLDPSAVQALTPFIYTYLFQIERLLLASSVASAAAAAASNPSPPPHMTPNNPFTTFPIHDMSNYKDVTQTSKKRPREEKKVDGEGDDDAVNTTITTSTAASTKTATKNRPKRGRYRNYDREALDKAVAAVQSGEMSVHRAGTFYGVPHSTLEYKVKQRHLLRDKKRNNSISQSREESDGSPTENGLRTTKSTAPETPSAFIGSVTTTSEDGSIGLE